MRVETTDIIHLYKIPDPAASAYLALHRDGALSVVTFDAVYATATIQPIALEDERP